MDSEIKTIENEIRSIDRDISRLKQRKSELLAAKQILVEQKIEQETEILAKSHDWESATKFQWSDQIHLILKDVFKLSEFRLVF